MRAVVQHRYGPPDVLELKEVEPPRAGDGDVLVRVRACGLNAADWHLMRADPWLVRVASGLRRPRRAVLGSAVAGVVESVGGGVTGVRSGDEVMAEVQRGGLAELVAVRASAVGPKPASLTFDEAASLPLAGTTALQALRDAGRLRAGQRALVIGASGGVGHLAVQIARSMGAEVAGVTSTHNVDLVASLGAAHVVDYTRQDVAAAGERYDVVLDAVGTLPVSACRRLLTRAGRYVAVGAGKGGRVAGPVGRMARLAVLSLFVSQVMLPFLARSRREDLVALHDLVESGDLRPVIDRRYALEEAADAVRYLEGGHVRGKLVVTV